eukprot:2337387-Rhodomonas_salina.2
MQLERLGPYFQTMVLNQWLLWRDEDVLQVDGYWKSTGMQRFWYSGCKRIEIPISPRHRGTLVGELGEVVKEFVPFSQRHQVPPWAEVLVCHLRLTKQRLGIAVTNKWTIASDDKSPI